MPAAAAPARTIREGAKSSVLSTASTSVRAVAKKAVRTLSPSLADKAVAPIGPQRAKDNDQVSSCARSGRESTHVCESTAGLLSSKKGSATFGTPGSKVPIRCKMSS